MNQTKEAQDKNSMSNQEQDWDCMYPALTGVYHAAQRAGVDLVVVDPDLLDVIDNSKSGVNPKPKIKPIFRASQDSFKELGHKNIIHLAAINETSGGQPSLKTFVNDLKNQGYYMLKFEETSQTMLPEVYRRLPHLFDDMPMDRLSNHEFTHEFGSPHMSNVAHASEFDHQQYKEDSLYKIYTDFLAHLFILNITNPTNAYKNERKQCEPKEQGIFVPIHIMVLYNFAHDPSTKWIQPSLTLDEIEKHKLLEYNVHYIDFRVPIIHNYIHDRRQATDFPKPQTKNKHKPRHQEKIRIFEPRGNRYLQYINNSYIHCQPTKFGISSSDDYLHLTGYLKQLEISKPKVDYDILKQLNTIIHFMDTFSKAYENFSYWLTGSALLAYHKFCTIPLDISTDIKQLYIDIEFGLFGNELNSSILNDLANARSIGVNMQSDWRVHNSPITFRLHDSPKFLVKLYIYKSKKDPSGYRYETENSMIYTRPRKKGKSIKNREQIHVFSEENLNLCWTKVEYLPLIRVPCHVHEHLRRIYIIK